MLGSESLEKKVLNMQPLIDIRKSVVRAPDDVSALSKTISDLPPPLPTSPPATLQHVLPQQDSSKLFNMPGSSPKSKPKVKLFQHKSKPLNFPKDTRKTLTSRKSSHSNPECLECKVKWQDMKRDRSVE